MEAKKYFNREETKNEIDRKPEQETNEAANASEEPIIGVVVGCANLNVREEASVDSEIISVLEEGDEIMVNDVDSFEDFYGVCTASGIEGYCMKKYIKV